MLPKPQDSTNFEDNVTNMRFFIEHYQPDMSDEGPIFHGPEEEERIIKIDPQFVWTELQKNTTVITNGFNTAKDHPEVNGYYLCKNPCTEPPFSLGIHTEIYVECQQCQSEEDFNEECENCEGQGFTYRYLNEIWESL